MSLKDNSRVRADLLPLVNHLGLAPQPECHDGNSNTECDKPIESTVGRKGGQIHVSWNRICVENTES